MYLICKARDCITETELLGRLDVCLTHANTTGCMCHQYACTSSNGLLWICTTNLDILQLPQLIKSFGLTM